MDGPVLGAIITASVAAVVAIGGAVRGLYQSALDRRYDWRRRCLVDAQSAMLVLREALLAYGSALSTPAVPATAALPMDLPVAGVHPTPTPPGTPAVPADPAAAGPQSFVMSVPEPVEQRVPWPAAGSPSPAAGWRTPFWTRPTSAGTNGPGRA